MPFLFLFLIGTLPLRWLPGESLRDGLFTTASDVWSVNVVLYTRLSHSLKFLREKLWHGRRCGTVFFLHRYRGSGNGKEWKSRCGWKELGGRLKRKKRHRKIKGRIERREKMDGYWTDKLEDWGKEKIEGGMTGDRSKRRWKDGERWCGRGSNTLIWGLR